MSLIPKSYVESEKSCSLTGLVPSRGSGHETIHLQDLMQSGIFPEKHLEGKLQEMCTALNRIGLNFLDIVPYLIQPRVYLKYAISCNLSIFQEISFLAQSHNTIISNCNDRFHDNDPMCMHIPTM